MKESLPHVSAASPATRAAVEAILNADGGMSPAHRAAVLRALDRKTGAVQKLVPVSEMARSLGVPTATVWRWVKSGRIHGRREGARLTLVDKAEVESYVAANPPRKGRHKVSPPASTPAD